MKPEEKGARAEKMFFDALLERTQDTPSWFKRIKIASPTLDIRGVDAVAFIYPKGDSQITRVPIQVKSSEYGKQRYQQTMPILQTENVVVIVVTQNMSNDEIRLATYQALEKPYEASKRFGEFWGELMNNRFPRKKRQRKLALSRKNRKLAGM